MAAADIHGTNIVVGQRAQILTTGERYLRSRKVTAVGTAQVTLGSYGTYNESAVRVLEHEEIAASTGYDWASSQ